MSYLEIRKRSIAIRLERFRWALSGRVVAAAVTTGDGLGYVRVGDWVTVNGELRRVHMIAGPWRRIYLY